MNVTICYITARERPNVEWFFDSLRLQIKPDDRVQIIFVDALHRLPLDWHGAISILPKWNVWQGPCRLTKQDWWAASNSRNTGICLAQHDFIAFLDDRCVLLPGWLDAIREAQAGNYAVFGAYEKRNVMTVENGVIRHAGIVVGEDSREKYCREHWGGVAPHPCPGEWAFGCTLALPLEWALQVNGYEELMDGLGCEDVVFGKHLENNGFALKYDLRMKIIEDRTPKELGQPMLRSSKERHPNDVEDKGHKALAKFCPLKRASHQWDLRQVRADVMAGKPFPVPSGPITDWFDNQPLSEMTA